MHPREAAELHESGGSARNLLEPLLDTLQGRSHHLPVAKIGRPRQLFTGSTPRNVKPISQR
jgi:hypothetical protein